MSFCNLVVGCEADYTGIIGRWCKRGTCTITWLASHSYCTIQWVQQACTVWATWQQQSSGCHILQVPTITGPSQTCICTIAKLPSQEPWGGGSSRSPDISSMSFQVKTCMVRKNTVNMFGWYQVRSSYVDHVLYAFLSVNHICWWVARGILHVEWHRGVHFALGIQCIGALISATGCVSSFVIIWDTR